MKLLIAISLLSILLSGCLGVDQATYGKARAERDAFEKQSTESAAKLTELQQQYSSSQASLSACSLNLDTLQKQCQQAGTSCSSLQESYNSLAGRLALVKNNISGLAPYRNAKSLYLEVIKSGKAPGYSRLLAADSAVNATGDAGLGALWKLARDCPRRGGDCSKAYDPFESYLNAKIDDYVAKVIAAANS